LRRQRREARRQPVGADTHQLVDGGHRRSACQKSHLARTGFQRRSGIVHGRGAYADDDDALAGQSVEIDRFGRMGPTVSWQAVDEVRNGRTAKALAAAGHDHAACQDRLAGAASHFQLEKAVGARRNTGDVDTAFDRQGQRLAIPGKVIHPHRTRYAEKGVPCGIAARCPVPGLERQRCHAVGRAQKLLGRAQRLHARIGDPWSLAPGGGAIDDPYVGDTCA